MYVCMHVCMYTCMYVCMYVCIRLWCKPMVRRTRRVSATDIPSPWAHALPGELGRKERKNTAARRQGIALGHLVQWVHMDQPKCPTPNDAGDEITGSAGDKDLDGIRRQRDTLKRKPGRHRVMREPRPFERPVSRANLSWPRRGQESPRQVCDNSCR